MTLRRPLWPGHLSQQEKMLAMCSKLEWNQSITLPLPHSTFAAAVKSTAPAAFIVATALVPALAGSVALLFRYMEVYRAK